MCPHFYRAAATVSSCNIATPIEPRTSIELQHVIKIALREFAANHGVETRSKEVQS